MNLSFSTHNKRHTVFLVMVGWLFAMVSGVANACLLEARVTHTHLSLVELSASAQALHVFPGHTGVVADHDDDGSYAAKAPCLKACDDGAQALPKQKLTATQADPGPALFMSTLWTAVTPAPAAPRRMVDVQTALPELPIRIRYSRLTL